MTDRRPPRKPPRPLDPGRLQELAVAYVGRFATTRAKLASYLRRKIGERGWDAPQAPDVEQLVERLAALGYIDDAAYAMSKTRALGSRGYGERRVGQMLHLAGVRETDAAPARATAREGATAAAIRYAQRRKLGPFATQRPEPKARDRALSGMIRAGHGFDLARRLIDLPPDNEIDPAALQRTLES